MNSSKKNFTLNHASGDARTELHDELGLTGCEVSVNDLPAGAAVPFVHAHRQNEELYGILSGAGEIWLDGEVIALRAGDWLRVAPAARHSGIADRGYALCLYSNEVRQSRGLYDDRRDALRRKGAVALKFLLIEKLERQGGRQDR